METNTIYILIFLIKFTPAVTPTPALPHVFDANTDYTATRQVVMEFISGDVNEKIDCTWTAMP